MPAPPPSSPSFWPRPLPAPRSSRASRPRRLLAGLAAAGLALALAGCGRQPAASPAAAGAASAAHDAGKFKDVEVREDPVKTGIEAGDAGLAAQVRARLAGDPQLRRQHIEVDAEGGRVTLWGEAARPEDRAAAEQLARRTPGVAGVNNLVKTAAPAGAPR